MARILCGGILQVRVLFALFGVKNTARILRLQKCFKVSYRLLVACDVLRWVLSRVASTIASGAKSGAGRSFHLHSLLVWI